MSPDRRPAAAPFARPVGPTAATQLLRRRPIQPSAAFAPLPAPVGPYPYRLALHEIVGAEQAARVRSAGALSFHCLGDSGGWIDPEPQRMVARALVADRGSEEPPSFLFHLGDVVYPHGEEGHYGAQFFAPYAGYDGPIFAIPGNHDGEAGYPRTRRLDPFVRTFCASSAPLRDAALAVPRPSSRQPHVHWTLVHDWLWIVGMYSNVHEDGEVADEQLDWLAHELAAAPADVLVVLAVHRPVYSADRVHGSNLDLGDALDQRFGQAGRWPDLVLSAHCHSYQRYTRNVSGRRLPYLVAGAGGFHERHRLAPGVGSLPATFDDLPGLTLEAYADDGYGYLLITAGPDRVLRGEYRTVGRAGVARRDVWAISRSG